MTPERQYDVCLVVEGCYPFVSGGVSTWLDWLIRNQPDTTFAIVAIVADEHPREARYQLPENVAAFQVMALAPKTSKPGLVQPDLDSALMADLLCAILSDGELAAFDALAEFVARPVRRRGPGRWRRPHPPTYGDLTASRAAWCAMVTCYRRIAPHAAFPDFFWSWRNLVGGLMALVTAPIPPARIYHAISTGYAGLYAGRAARASGQRAALTEHGIYTNERRIDLIMADWIADSIESGLAGRDVRMDVREFWIRTFESYARIAYSACDRITTLYGANQSFQRHLGAAEAKLRVIPNGIDLGKFAHLEGGQGERPTVALIGRVVPIKDIEVCVSAAALVKRAIPEARVLVIGPTDEDPAYFEFCRRRVGELDLSDTVVFTGKVNILDYLPHIDIVVLTSISEAQPLVLLEAGAAGVPCVTTDVGSCREIIEGTAEEEPRLGAGGRVVPVMDAEGISTALVELLGDAALRQSCGAALRQRVHRYFTSQASADRYSTLYAELMAP